jgi:phage antirepressor YoqD-like protein
MTAYLSQFVAKESNVAVSMPQRFAPPAHLSGVKTMSSVEIVEVINQLRPAGKAELLHKNFMEKVRSHPGIDGLNFKHYYVGGNGKINPCYYLPKREAELMVMSESLEVQTKVYDRLTELEQQVATQTFKLPQTYAEALLELAANVQRTEALQLENAQKAVQIEQQTMLIETQKPSVEFVEKYVETDGALSFRTVAKLLGAKEADFRNFLADNKIRHRQGTKWTHYTKYGEGLGNAGYFTLKTGVSASSGESYSQSYFTPKGVEWITRKWNERKIILTRKASPVKLSRELLNA